MSGPVHLATQYTKAQRAAITEPSSSSVPLAPDVIGAARQAVAGVSSLGEIFAGGIHPEAAAGAQAATDLVKATDSIPGRLGGLVPRLGSTVAAGPAGGAAEARSTLAKVRSKLLGP